MPPHIATIILRTFLLIFLVVFAGLFWMLFQEANTRMALEDPNRAKEFVAIFFISLIGAGIVTGACIFIWKITES